MMLFVYDLPLEIFCVLYVRLVEDSIENWLHSNVIHPLGKAHLRKNKELK